MQNAVMAIISGEEQSIRCAEALQKAGFTRDDISIMLPDLYGAQELGFQRKTKATLGFTIGLTFAAVLGGEFAYFSFLWPGSLPASFVQELSPWSSVLDMASTTGIIGAIVGAFIGYFIPEYVVRKYDRKNKMSNSLISIHVDNDKEIRIAERILQEEGAQDVKHSTEMNTRRKPASLALQ